MGVRTPEACWALNKRQVKYWWNCYIYLVIHSNCMMMHGLSNFKFILPKLLLQNISERCALPWDFYCISERHNFRSLLRCCEVSDTNVCYPTTYQRHHSIPRSVSRLRAVRTRHVDHSAVGRCEELILLLNIPISCDTKIWISHTQISFIFALFNWGPIEYIRNWNYCRVWNFVGF